MQMNAYEREHLQRLRAGLAECTVLLKGNGDFPLGEAGEIALYGSGIRHTVKGGTGSGEVNSRFFVNVEQGMKDAGFVVTTDDWLDAYEEVLIQARKDFAKVVKARAKEHHTMAAVEGMGAVMPEPEYTLPLDGEGDVAVYVLSRISGEGNDRNPVAGDIRLSETEIHDILALQRKYGKFLLVLNVGGPVDLTPVLSVENILVLSQLGVETGAVLADIILGKAYPSGKLTTTWSAWEDYADMGSFGDPDDTHYCEGVYVGYRYFDSVGRKALFPFGYGCSYTTFEVKPGEITSAGDMVTVTAEVRNTGGHPGMEVVQLYVSKPEGKLDQPYQDLAAFVRTKEILPGETANINLSFAMSELCSYDTEQAAYVLEEGSYVLRLGTSSADTTVCGMVSLAGEAIVRKCRNCLGGESVTDWKPEHRREMEVPSDVSTIVMRAEDIPAAVVEYDREQEIDGQIDELADEELAYLNIGAFDPGKGGIASIIGNASFSVAGAAGETTRQLVSKQIPAMVMSDGPAGLRLSRQYYQDEKGVHSIGAAMPESLLEYLPKPVAWFMSRPPKLKPDVEIKEQYATAIPIGTALAQSFDPDYAKLCGDIVGDEMERFGVHLWLAPALNIHRSIRCGRNFEYFSEDPLVSGIFAAAITDGVQAHPGCGTTIKHYAANNQETNRYNNNSQVSERAMREIYLRGFEICVKLSQPHALMTSYNLLNGTHTSEHRGLIEDILRAEFGYEGIVMTDWVTGGGFLSKGAKYPAPHAARVAAAGNDLFMPGSPKEFDEILAGLADGTVSREQLKRNATRVYRMAKYLVG